MLAAADAAVGAAPPPAVAVSPLKNDESSGSDLLDNWFLSLEEPRMAADELRFFIVAETSRRNRGCELNFTQLVPSLR